MSYRLQANEICADFMSYRLQANEICADFMSYRLQANEICADAARAHKRVDTKVSTLL
mgnify:CR=1 FL=1